MALLEDKKKTHDLTSFLREYLEFSKNENEKMPPKDPSKANKEIQMQQNKGYRTICMTSCSNKY